MEDVILYFKNITTSVKILHHKYIVIKDYAGTDPIKRSCKVSFFCIKINAKKFLFVLKLT